MTAEKFLIAICEVTVHLVRERKAFHFLQISKVQSRFSWVCPSLVHFFQLHQVWDIDYRVGASESAMHSVQSNIVYLLKTALSIFGGMSFGSHFPHCGIPRENDES